MAGSKDPASDYWRGKFFDAIPGYGHHRGRRQSVRAGRDRARALPPFDFALSRELLQSLRGSHTILPTYKMHVDGHSALKGVGQDCEMHLGATLTTEGSTGRKQ
jgi:hypothetical protein